jgi:release factor glutamine methyltransferase
LPRLLKPAGIVVFEIGIGQADAIRALFQKTGFAKIETRKDLSGIERCLTASL